MVGSGLACVNGDARGSFLGTGVFVRESRVDQLVMSTYMEAGDGFVYLIDNNH